MANQRVSKHKRMKRCIATIGFFDGVHKGHLCLIEQLQKNSRALGLDSLIVTFDRHPRQVLCSDYVPSLLSTLDEKVALLRQTGVDEVRVLSFTPEMASMDARTFMRDVLVGELNVGALLMGYDHRFGHDGGSFTDYCMWGKELGIDVLLATEFPDSKVSSSVIRKRLSEGDVSAACELLGRPYQLRGVVVGGHHIGHTIGYPTANLSLPEEKLVPLCGVYAVRVLLPNGRESGGMLCIGSRPTMNNGENISVEVNIFDFSGYIYNKEIMLEFVSRLRDQQAFASVDFLCRQLAVDEKNARMALGMT